MIDDRFREFSSSKVYSLNPLECKFTQHEREVAVFSLEAIVEMPRRNARIQRFTMADNPIELGRTKIEGGGNLSARAQLHRVTSHLGWVYQNKPLHSFRLSQPAII